MITIPTYVIFLIVGGIFTLIPALITIFVKNKKLNIVLSVIGAIMFTILVLFLTLPAVSFGEKNTIISFSETSKWFNRNLSFGFENLNLKDVLINLFMLAPLGVLLTQGFLVKLISEKNIEQIQFKNCLKIFLICFLLGLSLGTFIEICQSILPYNRFPTITDLFLNGLGCFIGSFCLICCFKIKTFFEFKK